jgi:hypothetical protein
VTLPFTGLVNPISVAVDVAGDVFVADTGLDRVFGLTPGGTQITVPFTGMSLPLSVSTDGFGDVFVLDWLITSSQQAGTTIAAKVIEYSRLGEQRNLPVASLDGVPEVQYLAADRAGDLLLTEEANNRVVEFSVDHAQMLSPVNGQLNVDTTQAFTWSPIPDAQGYILVVGTTVYGTNLVNTGVLPPTASSFSVPALPTGKVLYATVLTESGGTWTHYQVIGFTAAARH